MLNRRQVLVGAGLLAAATTGAAVEMGANRRARLLRALGLSSSPDHRVPASGVSVESGQLRSPHMRAPVGWSMSVPSPVVGMVVCLHGRGEDHHFAFDRIHIHDVVAASGVRLAVASVDGGSDSYWHPRADGSDALAMLLEEFIPLVDARVGRLVPRALLGWSMGGYGALLTAERAPERFRAVAVASPALWTSPASTAPGAFDSPDDYHRNDVFAGTASLAGLTVRIDCGSGDGFYDAARRFAAELGAPNPGSFGAGFHEDAYWRSVAPGQIHTISTALVSGI